MRGVTLRSFSGDRAGAGSSLGVRAPRVLIGGGAGPERRPLLTLLRPQSPKGHLPAL